MLREDALAQSEDTIEALRIMGLVAPEGEVRVTPLTGGVSSDISLVETDGRRFCVKRALARLKVAALWEAPIERNAAEAAWLETVAEWLPDAVPRLLGKVESAGLFAMDYLPPQTHPLWKSELLAGEVDDAFAASVGGSLVAIHTRSADNRAISQRFANDATFEAIRIEPYLRATAHAHPALAERIEALARATLSTRRALVHGDVSPKNILRGPRGPVLLDAECAWFGDPAFDLAFCLNHLLLKGARSGADRGAYLRAYDALANAYLSGVDWEAGEALEARAAALLPALFLARVDGKSPVEYLTSDRERDAIRRCASPLIASPPRRLREIGDAWSGAR